MARFDTVLIANRGEIAVRIIRTARAQGYRTVAVHSDVDADAAHVRAADVAVAIGPAPAAQSYLDVDRVLAAARQTGAGAIHPGYGFLSENAAFAEACADAGIVFVGPTPEAIRLMGDKAAAKRRMAAAGVPLLPGYQGEDQDDARLLAEADAAGFPLMVKAAAGGGGKGMRLVLEPAGLQDAIDAARREAMSAFGSDVLILERAVLRPRHVEIQVLADEHGHVIALGERDCSIQRRHQKVIEESPSPAVDPDLRTAMQEAAVAAARDVSYVGAGTVEFLLADDGTFAFLEMNTRLQVEHPVTEFVTGLDLVDWQLRIAQGEHLTITQDQVQLHGHAIEARLYAEDADNGYLPQTGTVHRWVAPTGDGIRVDAGIVEGSEVTAFYDPMIAKVIAHGRDREEARRRLADALDRTVLAGVTTNRTFLARILRHPTFASGEATTAFLDEHPISAADVSDVDLALAAAWLHFRREAERADRTPGLVGWSNAGALYSRQSLLVRGAEAVDVQLLRRPTHLDVTIGERTFRIEDHEDALVIDGERTAVTGRCPSPGRALLHLRHRDLDVSDVLLAPSASAGASGAGVLVAPMHGAVTAVSVSVGDRVVAGDKIAIMEAMKMEHVIAADIDGTVTQTVVVGAQVATDDVLVTIEPDEASVPAS